jgi:hypothetical protein
MNIGHVFLKGSAVFSTLLFLLFFSPLNSGAEMFRSDLQSVIEYKYKYSTMSIKTVNGKFYAYTVLLFNENPHFVNIIQKGTISIKEIGNEGFHVKAYRNYINSIQEQSLQKEASLLLKLYNEPDTFSEGQIREITESLAKRNIILKFRREGYRNQTQITLDYCIFGEKIKIDIKHPLADYNEDIYYIKPFIYYDEFSTSNSTFYYDMIYINPEEVENDFIIARDIVKGREVRSMFFVGARVNDDIKGSLIKAFPGTGSIKHEILRMFVIHELTHKIMDNTFNNFDQVSGEELAMSSAIYANPYLGLAVLYSYLSYSSDNPHRFAALNFIAYVSENTGNKEYLDNPGLIKNLPHDRLRDIARGHFLAGISRLKK